MRSEVSCSVEYYYMGIWTCATKSEDDEGYIRVQSNCCEECSRKFKPSHRLSAAVDDEHEEELERQQEEEAEEKLDDEDEQREAAAEETANPDAHRDERPYNS